MTKEMDGDFVSNLSMNHLVENCHIFLPTVKKILLSYLL